MTERLTLHFTWGDSWEIGGICRGEFHPTQEEMTPGPTVWQICGTSIIWQMSFSAYVPVWWESIPSPLHWSITSSGDSPGQRELCLSYIPKAFCAKFYLRNSHAVLWWLLYLSFYHLIMSFIFFFQIRSHMHRIRLSSVLGSSRNSAWPLHSFFRGKKNP